MSLNNNLLYTYIWNIQNFSCLLLNDENNNSNKLSHLHSPLFSVPFNQEWKFNLCLHPNGFNQTKKEFISLSLHAYDGPLHSIKIECEVFINDNKKKEFLKICGSLKKDMALECSDFVNKNDQKILDEILENNVFKITCKFTKIGKYNPKNKIDKINHQDEGTTQAKINNVVTAECYGKIDNNIKNQLKKKNDLVKKFEFSSKEEKKRIFFMDVWFQGRLKNVKNYISVAFRATDTNKEFENAQSKISIIADEKEEHSKVISGVLSSNKKTHFGCDRFIKTDQMLQKFRNFISNESLKIKCTLELFSLDLTIQNFDVYEKINFYKEKGFAKTNITINNITYNINCEKEANVFSNNNFNNSLFGINSLFGNVSIKS